jgi:hypothetical protein
MQTFRKFLATKIQAQPIKQKPNLQEQRRRTKSRDLTERAVFLALVIEDQNQIKIQTLQPKIEALSSKK